MSFDLALYARLLVLLLGTLLYGFVTRELWRGAALLPGNRPMRLLVALLTVGYAGGLLDEIARLLLGGLPALGAVAVARGTAWLLSFPLLAHGVWHLLPERAAGRPRPRALWLLPPYAMLLAFSPAVLRYASDPALRFEEAAWALFPLVALHTTVSLLVVARLVLFALRNREDRGLVGFLNALLATLLGMAFLNGLVSISGGGALRGWLWQLSTLVLWLTIGLTLIYFVQRYNVLRLSLTFRSLRHLVNLLAAVLIAMLSAPAVTGHEAAGRFVAWAILLSLSALLLARPLTSAVARRFRFGRRLFGSPAGPEEIERLLSRVRRLSAGEGELLEVVSGELSSWLSTPVRFARPGESENHLLASRFASAERGFTRIDPPDPEVLSELVRRDLHAVFPLRVQGRTEALLLVSVGPTGGGYSPAELSAVEVVLSQTATILELRRLAASRLLDERRLAERERLSMLGLTAASLAHEVKNPLSSMKAITQTVREELPPGSEHAQDLALVLEQIDRLARVTADVLGFARGGGGEGEPVDLPRLLRSAVAVLTPEARSLGVGLALTMDVGRSREVPGTVGAWQTITFNLLLNAIRHAPRGSAVEVHLSLGEQAITFETVNAGPAIPVEVAGRLFSPFVTRGGTGLGLSLVKDRVEELGGRVDVENAEGRVVFRVRL